MNSLRLPRSDYVQFLSNPQKQGVWSLTIQPDSASVESLRTLLNLQDFPFRRYRYADTDSDESYGVPATIVPRMFAYLRYFLPKKQTEGLPPLFPFDRESWAVARGVTRRRFVPFHYPHEVAAEPRRLGPSKRRAFSKALLVFSAHFRNCTIELVPERPSALDIISPKEALYFQVVEDSEGRISVYALQEETCLLVKKLIDAFPDVHLTCESRKVFSPETQLLSMYMPSLELIVPRRILPDASVLRTISQTMSEVREDRFVHAIRAIGIGAEELIVEVFETYLHDKAPEAPLGNLLSELNSRIQEVQSGEKAKTKKPSSNLKKSLGSALSVEKKKANPNPNLCTLFDVLLHGIVPTLEQLSFTVSELEEVAARPQKTVIFPPHVNRSLSDLVPLRNRVSHRVDRLGSARTVTYLEAALALKSYIVLALWWQEERKQIDYRVTMKDAIKKAIERNRAEIET